MLSATGTGLPLPLQIAGWKIHPRAAFNAQRQTRRNRISPPSPHEFSRQVQQL
jgi:hypothetical protein